jgi:hypothetical protein
MLAAWYEDIKPLGGLPLGDPLGAQVAILVKQFGASVPIPSLLAISIATVCVMDYSAHSYLLPKLIPCEKWMAKDGEVATALQVLSGLSRPFSEASSWLGGRRRDRGLP